MKRKQFTEGEVREALGNLTAEQCEKLTAMINERLRQERGLARLAKAADMSVIVFAFLGFASMVVTVALLAGGVI